MVSRSQCVMFSILFSVSSLQGKRVCLLSDAEMQKSAQLMQSPAKQVIADVSRWTMQCVVRMITNGTMEFLTAWSLIFFCCRNSTSSFSAVT